MKKTLWKKAGVVLLALGILICALPAMDVKAAGKTITSLHISSMKTSYVDGEALDLSETTVNVEYSDGSTDTLTYDQMVDAEITATPANGTILNRADYNYVNSDTLNNSVFIPVRFQDPVSGKEASKLVGLLAKTDSTGGDAHCSHDFEWEVQREATSTTDGLEYYKCKKCGYVKTVLEISGYTAFTKDIVNSISKAEANANVTFDTSMWVSFPSPVFDALAARPDVSLTVNYKFEGKYYTVTIPANADLTGLVDENGFCGFRNLDARFGGSEVVK